MITSKKCFIDLKGSVKSPAVYSDSAADKVIISHLYKDFSVKNREKISRIRIVSPKQAAAILKL